MGSAAGGLSTNTQAAIAGSHRAEGTSVSSGRPCVNQTMHGAAGSHGRMLPSAPQGHPNCQADLSSQCKRGTHSPASPSVALLYLVLLAAQVWDRALPRAAPATMPVLLCNATLSLYHGVAVLLTSVF